MGTYVYKIAPSRKVTVEGLGETLTAHLAQYAYKPYGMFCGWDDPEKLNQKMHFRSGAQGCDNAWRRCGGAPEYVIEADSVEDIPELYGSKYGDGAALWIPAPNVRGHYHDHYIGWFLLGYVYRTDDGLVLQYRELDINEVDPRRERVVALEPKQDENTGKWRCHFAVYGTDGRQTGELMALEFGDRRNARYAARKIVAYCAENDWVFPDMCNRNPVLEELGVFDEHRSDPPEIDIHRRHPTFA